MHSIKVRRGNITNDNSLRKRVLPKNDMTGNVSLTYEEWDKIYHGEIEQVCVKYKLECGRYVEVTVEITDNMLNGSWQCKWRGCIIMPYATP